MVKFIGTSMSRHIWRSRLSFKNSPNLKIKRIHDAAWVECCDTPGLTCWWGAAPGRRSWRQWVSPGILSAGRACQRRKTKRGGYCQVICWVYCIGDWRHTSMNMESDFCSLPLVSVLTLLTRWRRISGKKLFLLVARTPASPGPEAGSGGGSGSGTLMAGVTGNCLCSASRGVYIYIRALETIASMSECGAASLSTNMSPCRHYWPLLNIMDICYSCLQYECY